MSLPASRKGDACKGAVERKFQRRYVYLREVYVRCVKAAGTRKSTPVRDRQPQRCSKCDINAALDRPSVHQGQDTNKAGLRRLYRVVDVEGCVESDINEQSWANADEEILTLSGRTVVEAAPSLGHAPECA